MRLTNLRPTSFRQSVKNLSMPYGSLWVRKRAAAYLPEEFTRWPVTHGSKTLVPTAVFAQWNKGRLTNSVPLTGGVPNYMIPRSCPHSKLPLPVPLVSRTYPGPAGQKTTRVAARSSTYSSRPFNGQCASLGSAGQRRGQLPRTSRQRGYWEASKPSARNRPIKYPLEGGPFLVLCLSPAFAPARRATMTGTSDEHFHRTFPPRPARGKAADRNRGDGQSNQWPRNTTIWALIKSGKLESVRVHRRRLIVYRSLEKLLAP